jgi:formylglycine-generating enzyme required for sulfatase activity
MPVMKGAKDSPAEKEGMVRIPGGTFKMGSDVEDNAKPAHPVFVDTFMIDKYEVSAADFARFLNANGNPDDQYFSHDRYSTVIGMRKVDDNLLETNEAPEMYIPRKGLENHPANNVSWFGAYRYCQWRGKRLPSEAEWEKAARGRDERQYPWGNSLPDYTKARYNQKWRETGFEVMTAVDSLPEGASYYGVLNMSGNVWEWLNDWFQRDYCFFCDDYNNCSACLIEGKPCNYCPKEKPSFGHFKVLRGGSWYEDPGDSVIRSTYRYWMDPSQRFPNTGFRCAR